MSEQKAILVVDDNLASLTTLQSILERNYEVSLAKSAEIAQTILSAVNIDLILLDMEMPGLSGMEFLEILGSNPSYYHIPVIVVSSYGTPEVIINATRYGAVNFVVKPVSPDVLLEKVHSVLKDARLKINKIGLYRKLKILENAAEKGQRAQIDMIIEDLKMYYYELKTDMKIAELCRLARKMDYTAMAEKIKPLLAELSTARQTKVFRKL